MSYPGSKGQAGTFQRIIGQMPPHTVYVEPFLGSGQVFWRKRPAQESLLNDLSPGVIAKASAAVRNANFNVDGHPTVCISNRDALDWLSLLNPVADAVIYCDPPYLLSTRQGRFYYEHEMTEGDHRRLLALLQGMKCRVLLSGYPSQLYSSQLQTWRCISYRTRTRGRTVTECLWCNFPEPTELHDWRYAGKNFRQRLSFKRLAARWLARLYVMPPLKRNYLLNTIVQRQK